MHKTDYIARRHGDRLVVVVERHEGRRPRVIRTWACADDVERRSALATAERYADSLSRQLRIPGI